jgi:acetylornithine deacetylase/succinyl-diaminopimelate desuccinylase-like protein
MTASLLWTFALGTLLAKSNGFTFNRTESLDVSADVKVIRKTYNDLFSKPRSDKAEKDPVRKRVITLFKELGLETHEQKFSYGFQTGINLIGIRPGRNRGIPGKTDSIIVVASHWDTVSGAPGVDDNGSGSVAVVEVARLLHKSKAQLDHTVIFACNDLEELGLIGSQAFVKKFLIPKELIAKKADFLGAYVMDMDLIYNPEENSQRIPADIAFVSFCVL